MALEKRGKFGLDMEKTFEKVGSIDQNKTHTQTYTHTQTQKENRSKRMYVLTKPSVYRKLDEYARAHDDSLNGLLNALMEEFIEKNGL